MIHISENTQSLASSVRRASAYLLSHKEEARELSRYELTRLHLVSVKYADNGRIVVGETHCDCELCARAVILAVYWN